MTPTPTPSRPTVVCIDDDTLIREGIKTLLPSVDVVRSYASVEEYLRAPVESDVVVVDLHLSLDGAPALQGRHGVAAVAARGSPLLIYTNERRRAVLAACLRAGASGIAHKTDPLEETAHAVARVAAGEFVITTSLAGVAEHLFRRQGAELLSPRKAEVLRGRARGESFKSIAARMYIAPRTAEEYMADVSRMFAAYLRDHSPADLERYLGIGPGDLLDPMPPGSSAG